jgi:hypothetical protein
LPIVRPRLRAVALGFLGFTVLWPSIALGDPQISIALTIGGGAGELRAPQPQPLFHLGLHGDVMLFRKRDGQFDLGPYVEVLTRTFETFEAGGGASLLIPISEAVPIIVSGGPFVRASKWGAEGGLAGELFVGSRSFNFHSAYGFAIGGFAQIRAGFGPGNQLDVLGGLQIDLELLALPFVLLWQAFR